MDRDQIETTIEVVKQDFPIAGYVEYQQFAYKSVAKTLLRHLPTNSSILDFGSGPCDKAAVAQLLGYRVSACDDLGDDWHNNHKEEICAFAAKMGVQFAVMQDYTLPFEHQQFDMIMMHDVLEHLHDSPRMLLNELFQKRLKAGGLFFATIPNAVNIRKRIDVLRGKTNMPYFPYFYWNPTPWRGHVREYTYGDVAMLADFLHLDVLEISTRDHMLHRLSSKMHPMYKAITAMFPRWKDTWCLVARKRPDWTPQLVIAPDELSNIRRSAGRP